MANMFTTEAVRKTYNNSYNNSKIKRKTSCIRVCSQASNACRTNYCVITTCQDYNLSALSAHSPFTTCAQTEVKYAYLSGLTIQCHTAHNKLAEPHIHLDQTNVRSCRDHTQPARHCRSIINWRTWRIYIEIAFR